jgi:hypothetical protein
MISCLEKKDNFMIDFNISIEDAQKLLYEKMKQELRLKQRQGLIPSDLNLETISFKDLNTILETSILDLILLLPIEIVISQENIYKFIESTVHSLSIKIKREELLLFSARNFKKIVTPIFDKIKKQTENLQFLKN